MFFEHSLGLQNYPGKRGMGDGQDAEGRLSSSGARSGPLMSLASPHVSNRQQGGFADGILGVWSLMLMGS